MSVWGNDSPGGVYKVFEVDIVDMARLTSDAHVSVGIEIVSQLIGVRDLNEGVEAEDEPLDSGSLR
jgi:hypothetical protein